MIGTLACNLINNIPNSFAVSFNMKRIIICMCIVALVWPAFGHNQDASFGGDDNDFADFEDFDADDDFVSATPNVESIANKQSGRGAGGAGQPKSVDANNDDFANIYENDDNDDDGIVEEEDTEFEHFKDEEEFEGFAKADQGVPMDTKTGEPKLTMAKVPLHFRLVAIHTNTYTRTDRID